MTFLLDTDVLSQSAKKRPHPRVAGWMYGLGASDAATSVVSIAEIECGIERQRQSGGANTGALLGWLETLLGVNGPAVWPVCTDAARLLGRMHTTPALRHFVTTAPGQTQGATGADLAIAAIAIVRRATIATRNVLHFRQIHACFPLPGLYNPFLDS